MARPGFMPLASATALTVAAGLSIAVEQARSYPAPALGALLVHPVLVGMGDGGAGSVAARDAVATPAKDATAVAPSPAAVGSRALTGPEEE
jgi:hypothetical protein